MRKSFEKEIYRPCILLLLLSRPGNWSLWPYFNKVKNEVIPIELWIHLEKR